MKRAPILSLGLLLATAALAQFSGFTFSGGGIAGTGLSALQSSGTYHNDNSNSRGSGESRDTPPSYSRRRKSAEQIQYEHDLKEFHKILKQKNDNRKTQAEWRAFAQRTGWPAAWYNYASTSWRLGDKEEAAKIFDWTSTNCSYDSSICTDSKNNRIQIEYEMGHDAFVAGDYTAALAHYQSKANMTPLDPYAWHNVSAAQFRLEQWRAAADSAVRSLSLTQSGDAYEKESFKWRYETEAQVEWVAAVSAFENGYLKEGWTAATERHLNNALRYERMSGVNQPEAHGLLTWVLHSEGRDYDAEEHARKALQEDPNNRNAQKFLCLKYAGSYCK